jgi:AcrR family transcriptional regulator
VAAPRTARAYRSTLRARQAAQTREAILAAATELFATQGWAGTAMRDIADAAGVSVETVYSSQGSKIALLLAAVDAAVVGDLEDVGLADRPEFAAVASGSRGDRAAALAALGAGIQRRTVGLHLALREAAAADAVAADRLAELEERRRADIGQALALVAGRPVTDEERDGLWAITGAEVYDALTRRSGWTEHDFQTWAADVIVRLLEPAKGET